MSYQWKPIEDLPSDWETSASSEVQALAEIWKDQSDRLSQSEAQRRFDERLSREWAIETGVIERVYTIDRGTTELLIEKGIEASLIPHGATDKPAELVVSIVKDHQSALEHLFDFVAGRRELTTSYIKELHQVLLRHQDTVSGVTTSGTGIQVPLLRGGWKQQPNNPLRSNGTLHEYCPPIHVPREMERLVEMHEDHLKRDVSPEVEAAWLHHRFAQIHPFMDGNGRVARALASMVFIRDGWFPLVGLGGVRERYLDCLETADKGDICPLVALFSELQIRAFNNALSISEDLIQAAEPLDVVIDAATKQLRLRKETRVREQQQVFRLSRSLEQHARSRLQSISDSLDVSLRTIDPSYSVLTDGSTEETDFWFNAQILHVAEELGYYADTRSYRAWVRMRIREDRQATVVLSFHSLGVEFLGIMAASAFIEYRDTNEDGGISVGEPRRICPTVFQFSYKEDESAVMERFSHWLDEVMILGLEEWRTQL